MAGESSVVPYLMVSGARAAVTFYAQAFGAEELERYEDNDGVRLGHVTLRINQAHVYLADEYPEMAAEVGALAPSSLGGTTTTIVLHVDDADRWWRRAVDAGATVIRPLSDQFYGRHGKLRDPFGHVWSILQPAALEQTKT